jgi:hypothetical protein
MQSVPSNRNNVESTTRTTTLGTTARQHTALNTSDDSTPAYSTQPPPHVAKQGRKHHTSALDSLRHQTLGVGARSGGLHVGTVWQAVVTPLGMQRLQAGAVRLQRAHDGVRDPNTRDVQVSEVGDRREQGYEAVVRHLAPTNAAPARGRQQ